ncbi:hypothetical protein [Halorussus salinus]|uniref:hypothetical protein n=1 Tax=Halorussus salinus TaxID=1364935 RepID=UPI00109273A2|nr:hypothetical protein [Halorussus salinus]
MATKRRSLTALLVTKRGVILLLVVSAGVLGAGFGVLPGLLGGSDPADSSVGPTTEETPRTTAAEANSATPTATATRQAGTSDAGDDPDETTLGATTATDDEPTATTAAATETPDSDDDRDRRDRRDRNRRDRDDDGSDDGDPQVGVQAEANATASSLSAPPRVALTRRAVAG